MSGFLINSSILIFWTPGFVAKLPNTLALLLYLEQSLRAESCLLDLNPQKVHQKEKKKIIILKGCVFFIFFPVVIVLIPLLTQ